MVDAGWNLRVEHGAPPGRCRLRLGGLRSAGLGGRRWLLRSFCRRIWGVRRWGLWGRGSGLLLFLRPSRGCGGICRVWGGWPRLVAGRRAGDRLVWRLGSRPRFFGGLRRWRLGWRRGLRGWGSRSWRGCRCRLGPLWACGWCGGSSRRLRGGGLGSRSGGRRGRCGGIGR